MKIKDMITEKQTDAPFLKELSYQERVVAERDARTEEVSKLDAFITSEAFILMEEKSKILLERQQRIMHELVGVLNARIAIF